MYTIVLFEICSIPGDRYYTAILLVLIYCTRILIKTRFENY